MNNAMSDPPRPASSTSPATPDPPTTPAPGRVISSDELLRGQTEIFITHDNQLYRLRLTRNGKLLLQK